MTKVSIVTVCYNAVAELPGTIQSVRRQSHTDIDHVVVDGGSTDGSIELLREQADHARVFTGSDRGIYDAMNKGLARATGDVIIFMNAGDFFFSNYSVELAVEYLDDHPAVDIAYGGIEIRNRDGRSGTFLPDPGLDHLDFLITRSLPHQATFARRRAFATLGLFDRRYRSHGDYDWFLRAAADERICMKQMPIMIASFGLGGASSDLERGERERHHIQNGFVTYRQPEWMARRIAAYQELYIGMRVAAESA